MGECCQKKCNQNATHRVLWPGEDPLLMCAACAKRATIIASAMGFGVVVDSPDDDTIAKAENERGE